MRMDTQEYQGSHYDLSGIDTSTIPRKAPHHQDATHQHSITVASDLLTQRVSCRYFLQDEEPSDETLKSILEIARHAPSGSNFQPWKVHILRGEIKSKLAKIVKKEYEIAGDNYHAPYTFYPGNDKLEKPEYDHYSKRRKAFGKHFYGPLNIPREDKAARKALTARNWSFFDAPIGILITTMQGAPEGAYLDVGFFAMSLIVALRAHGLECCVQEAHATFHDLYKRELGLDSIESVVCGMAVGYADMEKVKKLTGHQDKMSPEELAVFHG